MLLVRTVFGVEPSRDVPGLLGGEPPPTPGEPDEGAQFEAYMGRYFRASVGSRLTYAPGRLVEPRYQAAKRYPMPGSVVT